MNEGLPSDVIPASAHERAEHTTHAAAGSSAPRRRAEKQVLFRLDEALLQKLDRRLAQTGYKTRNAWFKAVVESFVKEP